MNTAFNVDCLEYMRTLPDDYFDICVADPPYGAGFTEGGGCKGWFTKYHQEGTQTQYNRFGNPGSRFEKYKRDIPKQDNPVDCHNLRGRFKKYDYEPHISVKRTGGDGGGWKNSTYGKKIIQWDVAPKQEVFDEIFRVSKEQIIWGGNYFSLPPTRCFLIWRKLSISESFTMAMAEYAWTSFNSNAKVFECAPQGKANDERFHPTQKPIDLYRWIFRLYAEKGMKVFDPFLGSGSSRIAAYDAGLDFVGCEIDKEYFEKQEERFAAYTAQTRIEGF